MPSASIEMPSLMNVPITREVKKPRESLTTIGVLAICLAKSRARYTAASEVFSPLMISSSGILSTGEKKCRPMKSSGRETFSASAVIGSVEVFEPSSASGARNGSISAMTCCLTPGSSKTASMTRSAPSAADGVVGRGDQGEQRVALLLRGLARARRPSRRASSE